MALDPKETSRLRRVIEDRLVVLQQDITEKLDDAAGVNADLERASDAGDQSVADDLATGDFADARRDMQEVEAARAALARMDSGDYGTCIDCGLEIAPARLRAQPVAARCIHCQQKHERDTGFHSTTM
jgi:DnaK suppressor protein